MIFCSTCIEWAWGPGGPGACSLLLPGGVDIINMNMQENTCQHTCDCIITGMAGFCILAGIIQKVQLLQMYFS